MDAILFGMKRAHHASLRFGHKVLAPFGLTPARFDTLYALLGYSVRQCELRRVLGVAGSTLSRMLASLERRGWVERGERRHTRRVSLTPLGYELIRRALRRVHTGRVAFRMVARAIRFGPRSLDFKERDDLDSVLRRFRRTFGDQATLSYPWHPDD